MNQQKVVIAEDLGQSLNEAMEACERDKVFILLDETTERCFHRLALRSLSPTTERKAKGEWL